jgi:outer membrane protein assembly factor BamB
MNKLLAPMLLCGLVFSGITQIGRADWTTYLGGNDRAGATRANLSPSLHLNWVYRSQAKPEMAWSGSRTTPIEGHVMLPRVTFDAAAQTIIADGRVYFGSTVDHRLHCLDETTGKSLWSFFTDGPIRLAPTYVDGKILFGSDDGRVYCLNAATGDLIWDHRVGPTDDRLLARGEMISRWPVRTGVLVEDNIAYFGAGVFPHEMIYLCAAELQTGEILWKNDRISQADAGRNDLSPQGYMLANDKYLYVPSGRSLPVAVSRETGEIAFQRKYSWRSDAGGVVGGTKALLGDGQIYAGGPHHFLAMDQNTGDAGEAYIGGRQMVLMDDRAYLLDGSKVFCVDRDDHARASQEKQEWFLRAREVGREPEKLAEAKAKIEEYAGVGVIWQVPSGLDGAMIVTSNLLIVGGDQQVVAFDRDSGKIVWEAQVEGKAMGLSATDSLLTVSTDSGAIYGFSTTAVEQTANWPKPFTEAFTQDSTQEYFQRKAEEIMQVSGQRSGYCLLVGAKDGRLAYELMRQSKMHVFVVEPDADKAAKLRQTFESAGVHAVRLTVVQAPLEAIPYSNYFANLIVSESQVQDGSLPCEPQHLARFLKPCGGVALLARTTGADSDKKDFTSAAQGWLVGLFQEDEGQLSSSADWSWLTRGKLPGAGEWTHQYGDAANTSFTNDQRVRDGLGVLWYGDPGPSAMINRHEAAGAPLSTNGRMFIQGTDKVMAYDAYNGNFLWELENPGAVRTGVFNNRETHNLAANDDFLFMAIRNECQVLDAASGKLAKRYETPESADGIARDWAFLAVEGDQVFGTNTIRRELEEKMRRRGLTVASQTDAIFAYDMNSDQLSWTYRGENILHTTIALGPEHVFFIDSAITPDQRQELYRRDKGALKELTGEAALKAEEEMKALDARRAICLDRRTGKKIWEKAVDVTDTTNVSAGGGSLTVIYADGHLVLCGANANGHYWKQFLSGEFEKRKLIVLDAATGNQLWSNNANYMNRPAVINDQVFAEPWAFDLKTGETKKRPHPLTGEDSDWRFSRPGHHCGIITATPNMMFFRSGFIGYYDLYADSGTQHFAGQRLGCWVNAIPGNGLVMIPEASAGCVCQFSIASTVVLEPKTETKAWGILSAVGQTTPVKRFGINLGAPGDRTDAGRQAWFGFPRPKTVERLEFEFDIQPRFAEGGGWVAENPNNLKFGPGLLPWLLASGARGLEHFEIPLLGPTDDAASYDVRLYFVGADKSQVAGLPIQLQGADATGNTLELNSDQKQTTTVCVREFKNVSIEQNLVYDCTATTSQSLPLLAAIEVFRSATNTIEDAKKE